MKNVGELIAALEELERLTDPPLVLVEAREALCELRVLYANAKFEADTLRAELAQLRRH